MKRIETEVPGVTPEDVDGAAERLSEHLSPTPLQRSPAFTEQAQANVYLKIESIQPIRAFKVRGALNKVMRLSTDRRRAGVVTASAGNHGLGVAYAANVFGMPATVYVPEAANQFKVDAIRRLGADVVVAGRNYVGAYMEAREAQRRSGAAFVHAYDDPEVVAGQGTIAVELLAGLERFDTVIVPIGGGGLIGGIAMYLKAKKPSVKVIGVEPVGADAMFRSLQAGSIVTLDTVSTIADGLAASAPGQLTLDLARRWVDVVVRIEEVEMLRAIRRLFEWEHLLAEPAGAAGLAALLYHHRPAPDDTVVVIISGANVTDEVMLQALKTR